MNTPLKYKLLALILILSLTSFSQTVTNNKSVVDTCKVTMRCDIARKVAIDIVRGDSARAELAATQDLLKEYLIQNKSIRETKRKKKEDSNLKKLKEDVKLHRETTVSDKLRSELKQAKERKKEIETEIDEGIEDELTEIKEINKDYREEAGYAKEKMRVVQAIL